MKGAGIFYSRVGKNTFFGDMYLGMSLDDIVMQDDYDISENKISLYDLDFDLQKNLKKKISEIEKLNGFPVRGTFKIEGSEVIISEYYDANIKGKEKIESMVDLFEEKVINKNSFSKNITFKDVHDIFSKEIIRNGENITFKGDSGSNGVGIGVLETNKEKVLENYEKGIPTIYVTEKPGSEDMIVMKKSNGMIMSEGDFTAHPVILAKSNNIPCVVNLPKMDINKKMVKYNGQEIPVGSTITIDGTNGHIYNKKMSVKENNDDLLFSKLDAIFNKYKKFEVYANADSYSELALAQNMGAEGIGLCRTEHMVFENSNKLNNLRTILYSDKKKNKHLEDFIKYQISDISKIYDQSNDQRVVIRLLDPPINEFLPEGESDIDAFFSYSGMNKKEYELVESELKRNASHLGVRGTRFGIIDPKIYLAQVEAILEAAGKKDANILLPFISFKEEFRQMKEKILDYKTKNYPKANLKIGAMIETPMSAIESDFYAKNADFISYGLNDLTMTSYALERIGSEEMMGEYVRKGIITKSPFESIVYEGMQKMLSYSINQAKINNPDILIGVCSEQVRDPDTLKFFSTLPIDYISSTGQSIPKIKYDIMRTDVNG
ncbi:MAG: putative PEP-binding protein [Nanobdellota archaeon]